MKIYRRGVKLDLSIAVVVMFLLLLHMTGMMYKRELQQLFNDEVNISKRGFRRFRSSEIVDKEDGTSKVPSEVAEGPAGTKTDHIPAYNMFHQRITKDAMYEPSAFYIFNLLDELATGEISNVSLFPGGSQIKFKIHFKNGNVAIAKPKRHDRGRYWAYDQSEPFWLDNERHNAEIASFHLDRILNFRRVPPCVGRIVNFRKEILPNTKDEEILSTLYINNGNFCFIGNCVPWFCNDNNPICSEGDFMEMSLCVLVYPSVEHPFQDRHFPWSQGIVESEIWKERNICTEMLVDPEITMGRFFLDLMDLAVFDHLIQNYDRHHFTIVVRFNVESFVVIVDNGKGFGNPWKDDTSFLAPIHQCCRIRNSTYQTLLDLSTDGSKLGNLLRLSLSQDPLAPVITEIFFETLERRLGQVLREIDKCIENFGDGEVLVDKVVVT